MRVKLIDFGLSNRYNEGTLLRTFCGSPQYASPELVRRRAYVGPEVDCWSLGVLLYFMVTGRVPFTGSSYGELYSRIVGAHYTLPSDVSDKCADLIGRMIVSDWRNRATITEICTHPWVLDLKGFVVPVENRRETSKPKRPEDLNSEVISRMKTLGYDEDTVVESVLKEKYDELCSTYHLLQARLDAAAQRSTRSGCATYEHGKHTRKADRTASKEDKKGHRHHHHKHHHHGHHHRHHESRDRDTKSHEVSDAVTVNKSEAEEPETDSQGQGNSPMTNRTLEQKDDESMTISPLTTVTAKSKATTKTTMITTTSTTSSKETPTTRKEEHFHETYHEEFYQSHSGQSSQSSATNSGNTLSSSDDDDSTDSESDGSSSSPSRKDGTQRGVDKHFFFGPPKESRHRSHRTKTFKDGTVKSATPSLTPCVTESTPIQLPVTEPCTPISPVGRSLLFPVPCTRNMPEMTRSSTATSVPVTPHSVQEQRGTHLVHVSIGSDSLSSSPLSHLCDADEVSSQEDMLSPEEEPAFMFSTNHMHSSEARQAATGQNKSHNHHREHRKEMAFATPLAMHMRSPQVPIKHSPLIPTCPDVPVSEPVTPKRDHSHPMLLPALDMKAMTLCSSSSGSSKGTTRGSSSNSSSHTPSPALVVTKPHHSPTRRHGFTGTPLTIPSYMCTGTSSTTSSTCSGKVTPVPRDGPNMRREPKRPSTANLPLTPNTQAGFHTPETSSGPANATPLLCEEGDDWEGLHSPAPPRFMLTGETEADRGSTTPCAAASSSSSSSDACKKGDTKETPDSTPRKEKKASSQRKKRPTWVPLEPERSSFCNSPAVDLLAPYTPTSPHASRTQPVPRRSGSSFVSSRPGDTYPRSGSSQMLRGSQRHSSSSSSPSTHDKKKAKEPRTTRFAFNVSLTSNKPAHMIVDTVSRVVLRHKELSVVMNDTFLMTVTHPAHNVEFQIEVCKIRFLSLRGVRFHRIRGDSQCYQEIVRGISSEIPKL